MLPSFSRSLVPSFPKSKKNPSKINYPTFFFFFYGGHVPKNICDFFQKKNSTFLPFVNQKKFDIFCQNDSPPPFFTGDVSPKICVFYLQKKKKNTSHHPKKNPRRQNLEKKIAKIENSSIFELPDPKIGHFCLAEVPGGPTQGTALVRK
jgi:hypothetical protein